MVIIPYISGGILDSPYLCIHSSTYCNKKKTTMIIAYIENIL